MGADKQVLGITRSYYPAGTVGWGDTLTLPLVGRKHSPPFPWRAGGAHAEMVGRTGSLPFHLPLPLPLADSPLSRSLSLVQFLGDHEEAVENEVRSSLPLSLYAPSPPSLAQLYRLSRSPSLPCSRSLPISLLQHGVHSCCVYVCPRCPLLLCIRVSLPLMSSPVVFVLCTLVLCKHVCPSLDLSI